MKTIFRPALLIALPLLAAGCGTGNTAETATTETGNTETATVMETTAPAATDTTANTATDMAADTTANATKMDAEVPAAEGAKTYRKAETPPGAPPEYVAMLKKVAVPMPPKDFKVAAMPRLKVTTNKGSFTLQLNAKEAPLHTKSFVYLAKRGFYDGTIFHRFADLTGQGGNIIQGGDPLSKSAETRQYAGQGGPGYEVPREHNKLTHEKLVIAMARSSDPDSAGSQFYITQAAVPFLDEGDGYTVFGKVVSGDDVAMKLRQDDSIKKIEVLK